MILRKFSIDAVKRATREPAAETSDEKSLQVVADLLRRYDADELSARSTMFGVARCMIAWASAISAIENGEHAVLVGGQACLASR
jgi:hypothetical protein